MRRTRFTTFCGAARRSVIGILALPLGVAAQHVGAPPPTVPLTPATIRADLAVLRTDFVATEGAYSPAGRTAAEARIALLERGADTLQRAYLELEVARIVALADNGHTNVPAQMRAARFNRVGIRLTPMGEDFYVLSALSPNADLLGARLVSIDGHPISDVRTVSRTLTGGTNAWRDRSAAFFLESPDQLHALGVIKQSETATYRFALRSGNTVERTLTANPANAGSAMFNSGAWMYPMSTTMDGNDWRSLLAPDKAPWSLQDPPTRFRWREAAEVDGVVIELRQNVSAPGLPIRTFLMQMDTMLRAKKPVNVVLDMRMNGGGDLNTTRAFVQSLPTLVSGRIFVLTSPYTFSAAISTVGYLKQAAPDRVSIVGETAGDRLMFWAEGSPIRLPNSAIMIGKTTERHDYETGCERYTDCHGPVVRNPIRIKTLAPDIAAPWTIDAYRSGADPSMTAVVAALKR